ncbi:Major Facilitator Superfamily protein [Rhodobacteraceae bacterium THAF1]|uniref:MFS transporter n=1 Tax=Palleronia sp. THAF1 TaxID=2587842 RepID=UPI000F3CA075|nr:MFS transporter [Palleronia sp. THAF1]QFU08964.1 Major Facilitator Superfamily protein [Palleronia sp. THAF1]VDC24298.1 Major Facilitator Superfamily protein [Rhodobacteraceae bacterium THAF1]
MSVSSDRTNWAVVAALFVTGLLAAWQFATFALTLPDLSAAYDRPVTTLAWLVSVVGLVGILLGAVAGGCVAAMGARRVLIFAMLLGAGMSLVQAFLPPLWLLGVSRVIEGVSHLLIVVAAPTLIAGVASDNGRPVAMAIWAMFFGVAFAIGAAIFPMIVTIGGLQALNVAHGLGFLVMAAVLVPMLPVQPRQPLRLSPVAMHRAIYGHVARAMPALCFVFYTVVFVAAVAFLPLALGRPGLAISLPLLSLSGTFAAGWLCKRVPPFIVLAAGFIAVALCGIIGWVSTPAAVYPMFATMGLVPGAAFALIPHLNAEVSDRALATGGIAQMGNVGTTLGTPMFALFYAQAGLPGLWAALVGFSVLGLAVTLGLAHLHSTSIRHD